LKGLQMSHKQKVAIFIFDVVRLFLSDDKDRVTFERYRDTIIDFLYEQYDYLHFYDNRFAVKDAYDYLREQGYAV
jgi:hypothetical protein